MDEWKEFYYKINPGTIATSGSCLHAMRGYLFVVILLLFYFCCCCALLVDEQHDSDHCIVLVCRHAS